MKQRAEQGETKGSSAIRDHRKRIAEGPEVENCLRPAEQRRGVTLPIVAGCGAVAPRTRVAAGAVANMPRW